MLGLVADHTLAQPLVTHLLGSVPLLMSPTAATRMLYTTRNTAPTATSGDKFTGVLHAAPSSKLEMMTGHTH
jgi:hypothetical protein